MSSKSIRNDQRALGGGGWAIPIRIKFVRLLTAGVVLGGLWAVREDGMGSRRGTEAGKSDGRRALNL